MGIKLDHDTTMPLPSPPAPPSRYYKATRLTLSLLSTTALLLLLLHHTTSLLAPARTPLPAPTCYPSPISASMPPSLAKQLAHGFCADVKAGKDAYKKVYVSERQSVHFLYEAGGAKVGGRCSVGCLEAFGEMVGRCQQDADHLNGESNFVDGCGEYTLRVRGLKEVTQKARLEVEKIDDVPTRHLERRGKSSEGISTRQMEADRVRMN